MNENDDRNLDLEYKRYLQIMRPHLGQLIDQDTIDLCNAWVQRLSCCNDNEKFLRNKYLFNMCYQLARGVLDEPFDKPPPVNELSSLSSETKSSTELEYLVIDSEDTPNTKVLYNSRKSLKSDTEYQSEDVFKDDRNGDENFNNSYSHEMTPGEEKQTEPTHKQTVFCYTCPEILTTAMGSHNLSDSYEIRTNNLIMKLRDIKKENILLHKELAALKDENNKSGHDDSFDDIIKMDNSTSAYIHRNDSSGTLISLKCKLQEIQDSRNILIQTVGNLQSKLDNFNEIKKRELEDVEAKYKLEIINDKASAHEEVKEIYEQKMEELKQYYETKLKQIECSSTNEIQTLKAVQNEAIAHKDTLLKEKDAEIARLNTKIDEQKNHLHSVLNKFIEKSDDGQCGDNIRLKAQELEKRLDRAEKSKSKCAKAYEAKMAYLQREKHLAECSLQLQLVRQRAQVVTEVTDESQSELTTALDKLETKYREIVANVQATAIQRRIQDQMTLETILQATCGIEIYNNSQPANRSRGCGKTMQNQNGDTNQSLQSEISTLLRGNKVGNVVVGNKSFGEGSVTGGYCLDSERLGDLFERVYIPQRDTGDLAHHK